MKKTQEEGTLNPFKLLFGTKIPLPYLLLICIFALSAILWSDHTYNLKAKEMSNAAILAQDDCPTDMMEIQLHDHHQLISPILLSDVAEESEALQGLKKDISAVVQQEVSAGQITNASVYVRSLNNGGWISVNGSEPYRPGSLHKVPVLITYLKQCEIYPGLLDKEIYFDAKDKNSVPLQTFGEKAIEPGKKYTIRELFNYMIIHSDNHATRLLNENLNIHAFQKLCTDLGMSTPDIHDPDFHTTVQEYSKFLRILYNSSYLLNQHSEYALSLLTQTAFKDGLMKPLPPGIKVAHKFGEWGHPAPGSLHQLHEAGIVYLQNNPYLITVMIKGPEVKNFPHVISRISKLAFDKMNGAL